MPPKPKEQVKGSGAEWYNIDFDPEILKKGAVVATAKVIKGQSLLKKTVSTIDCYFYRCIHSTEGEADEDAEASQELY